jgi:formylmethanofuran dehydrogenase subunit E
MVRIINIDTICGHAIDAYIKMIMEFHGHLAPGLLIGGFMIDLAMKNRPVGNFFDVLCETATCLPDAVQILTPCTYGNGWLKVINVGRFAITLFEKYSGEGVRVHLDLIKLKDYSEIENWFLKLKPKNEQNEERLIGEIVNSGSRILGVTHVRVDENLIGKKNRGKIAVCSGCREAYPIKDGDRCLACQGTLLFR